MTKFIKIVSVIIAVLIAAPFSMHAADEHALVAMSVACVREQPSHTAELGSQVVMGTPVVVLSKASGWSKVRTPDGYEGYIIDHSLQPMSENDYDTWRRSARVVVTAPYEITATDPVNGEVITDLVNGCILQSIYTKNGIEVTTPGGRRGIVPSESVSTIENWASQSLDHESVIAFARQMTGRPYLWGGTSTKGMDCSGLTSCAYYSLGYILPRNASQQAKGGAEVDKSDIEAFKPGDLLFFGNAKTGRVNHVAIYIGDGRYIHSSGRVKTNSLRRDEKDYLPLTLLHVRRYTSGEDSPRLSTVFNNQMYFID